MKAFLATCLLTLACGVNAAAQSTIFLVRHAERADTAGGAAPTMAADPDLSPAGRLRAESLAAALKDAGITGMFVTEYQRTRQTAAPLANALGITVTIIPSKDASTLAQKVKAATGNVLVVGHSNTIPELIAALGIQAPVKVDEAEYDNLFVVVRGERPVLVRLRYR